MTGAVLEKMTMDPVELKNISGGKTVKCYINKKKVNLAALRAGGTQTSERITMIPGGTEVLGSDAVHKDRFYTFRYCYVPAIQKYGWVADCLLR